MRRHLNNNPKWLEANKDGGSLDRLNESKLADCAVQNRVVRNF